MIDPLLASPPTKPVFLNTTLGIITAFLPCVIVYLGMATATKSTSWLKAGSTTMFYLHGVGMIGAPLLAIGLCQDFRFYRKWLKKNMELMPRQYKKALLLFTASLIFGIFGGQFIPLQITTDDDELPMKLFVFLARQADDLSIFVGLWFSFVNPIIEELFWRVYLIRQLGKEESIQKRIFVSATYSAYHYIVLVFLFGSKSLLPLVSTIELFIYGLLFYHLRQEDSFGWLSALGLHAGLDMSLIVNLAIQGKFTLQI